MSINSEFMLNFPFNIFPKLLTKKKLMNTNPNRVLLKFSRTFLGALFICHLSFVCYYLFIKVFLQKDNWGKLGHKKPIIYKVNHPN